MAANRSFYTKPPTKKETEWHRKVERGGATTGEHGGLQNNRFGGDRVGGILKEKYTVDLSGLCLMMAHNNQPEIGLHNGWKYEGEVQQVGGMGEL